MSNIKVVNHYHHKPTQQDLIIHRGNKTLGNPFPMKELANDREVVCNLHMRWFLEMLPRIGHMLRPIIESGDPCNLVCYCEPQQCHGDNYKLYIDFARKLSSIQNPVVEFRKLMGYRSPPKYEGIDHINIYSGSKTEIGRLLSNFAYSPFTLDDHGKFDSLEGYWFWLSTGCKHEELRKMWGATAKREGSKLPRVHMDYFDEAIDAAVTAKVYQNPRLMELLKECHLPFEHYYYYGNDDNAVILRSRYQFLSQIHCIRADLTGALDTVIAGSRSIKDPYVVEKAIVDSKMKIRDVICGMAKGTDILAWNWAKEHNIYVDENAVTKEEWEASKAAGHIRNAKMEKKVGQGIVLVEGNNSRGSEGMIKLLEANNKPVHIVRI